MWPALAIMAVSAIAQAYQSEQARGANSKELKRLRQEFDRVKGPEWDISIDDPIDRLAAAPLPPNYDMSRITPQTISVVGRYAPEVAARIQEQAPELARASANAQQGRQAQLQALDKYQQIAQGGADPGLAQALTQASQRGDREAQSRQSSVLQDAARRGTLGSGAMLAGQLQGSSDSSQRAATAQQLAAAESYRNRLNALSQGAQIGGQIRKSELDESQNNADIINQFNQRQTAAYQNYLNTASALRNQAQIRNLGEDQRVSELNSRNQYESDWQNRDYQNKAADTTYNRTLVERDKQFAAGQGGRERKDRLKQQMFANQMSKLGQQVPIVQMGVNERTGAAQDRNKIIQGVADTGARGYMNQQYLDRRYPQQVPAETQPNPPMAEREKANDWIDDDDRPDRPLSYRSGY